MTINDLIKKTSDDHHPIFSKLFRPFKYTISLPKATQTATKSGDDAPQKPPINDGSSGKKLDIRQFNALQLRHFTADMIPEPIRRWTLDNCAHAEGSLNFGAVSAIIVCSNLIGMGCQVKPKRHGDWMVTPNLWGMLIGEPSKRKSPVASQFTRPVKRLKQQAANLYKKQMREYHKVLNQQHIAQKVKNNAIKKAYEDGLNEEIKKAESMFVPSAEEPVMERFIVNDATSEKIGEIMSVNPRTLLMYRDELSGFLASFSKAGREGDRAFYLEAFNGNAPYSSDRIGRGTVHIDKLSVGIFGTIQPDVLSGFIASGNGGSGDGFIQRMQLAVFPDDIRRKYYDKSIDTEAKDRAYDILEKLAEVDYAQMGGAMSDPDGTPYFGFDDMAQRQFIAWYDDMKMRIEDEPNTNIQAHIGKYFGLLPALALTFFLIYKMAEADQSHAIGVTYVAMAIRWCEVLETHARKMYALANNSKYATKSIDQKIIEYVTKNHDKLPMSFGTISQGVRGATAGDVEKALQGIALTEGKHVKKLFV